MKISSRRIAAVGLAVLVGASALAFARSASAPADVSPPASIQPAVTAEGQPAASVLEFSVAQRLAPKDTASVVKVSNGKAKPVSKPPKDKDTTPDEPPVEPPAPPAAPGPVSAIACVSGDMQDVISYSVPTTGGPVATYTLSSALTPEGPFSVVATAGADATSFVTPVTQTGTYYYTVTTAGPGGAGEASVVVNNGSVHMEAAVPPSGKTLRASNGEVVLTLPAAAFSETTTVTVSEVSGSPVGAIISFAGIYDIEPSGALGAPATLSVSYTLAVTHHQVSDTLLRAAGLLTFSGGTWVSGATDVRAEGGYITGNVTHFSPWVPGSPSPHGTSESAVDYCTGVCHDLTASPGSTTRYSTRDPQVCYNCHGSSGVGLPAACGVGTNIQSEFFAITGQTRPTSASTHPIVAPGTYTSGFYCTLCHDPHAGSSSSPDLMRAWDPVTGLYVQGSGGNAPGDTFCWTCHGPVMNRRVNYLTPGYYTRTGGDKKVTYLTSAHASLPKNGRTTCGNCHTEHGSGSGSLLNASYGKSTPATVDNDRATGAYAQACLQCHDGTVAGAENIKQYVTQDAANTGAMSYGGHRIKSSGGTLPVNAPLPCTDCHGPHGSSRGNKTLLSDGLGGNFDTAAGPAAVRRFCFSCHTTPDAYGWDTAANNYVPVDSSALVEGLRRDGGAAGSGPDGGYNWLRLKVTPGHARTDTQSCYLCHGNAYGTATSKNVHNPDSYSVALHTATPANATITIKGVSYGPFACSTCHTLELGPEHDKSTASSVDTDCFTCHDTPRSSLTPTWNHNTCAQGNCHAGTSADPMHGTIDADHTTTGPCAVSGCHSQSVAAIHSAVGGPGCAACHAVGKTPSLSCGATGCHPAAHPNSATLNHGGPADSCTSCHSAGNLMGVHKDNCATCHPVPVTSSTVYAGGCSQAGCHPASDQIHNVIPSYSPYHYGNHGDGDDCFGCHSHGECGPCHSEVYERAKPTTTSNAKAVYTGAAVINLSATDAGEWGWASGVYATYYQIDGGPIQTGTSILIMGPATGSRSHSVEFWSTDNHYNTEAHKVVHFTVRAGSDTTPPVGTMAISNGATYTRLTSVALNHTVTDADTGVVSIRIDPGTGIWGAWQDYTAVPVTTLTAGDGAKTVRVEFKDAFNNVLQLSDSIILDATNPTGSFSVNNGALATKSLTVTLNANITDALSGVTQMSYYTGTSWTAFEPYAPTKTITLSAGTGTKNVYARYLDAAGNQLYISDSIVYDPTAPTGTMTINNTAPFTSSQSVTINSSVTDTGSGLYQMRFSNDNVTWSSWTNYTAAYAWTLSPGEELKTVYGQYSDKAGNILSLSDTITLGTTSDTDAPTGTVAINGGAAWTTTPYCTLTLNASDAGGAGVYEMRFSHDNSNWTPWEPYATSKPWTLSSGTGLKTVYVQYRDGVGNESPAGAIADTIGYDPYRPIGTLSINAGAAYTGTTNVTLALSYTEGVSESGVTEMRFSNDNATWTSWEPYAASKSWTLTSGAAMKTVYAQLKDGAGNISNSFSDSIAYLLQYNLTYSAGTGGTISGTTPQTVTYGASGSAVTAVPNTGYHFLGWNDGFTANPRTDVNVVNNLSPTALFGANGTYTVQFLTDGSGYVTGGNWVQAVAAGGSSVTVTASPYDPAYYTFLYWNNGANYVYTPSITLSSVNADQTWTAYFSYSGSCPFLFTWNGFQYVFEADEFAPGYLGLRTSKGYRRPNPIDYHAISTEPTITAGALEWKLVEERDEVDYLDEVKLYAVDAPADRDVYTERSQAEGVGTFTTLDKVIHTTAKNLQAPPSVTYVNTGEDVRAAVAASDGEYVIMNENRNAGYTYQTLELDLGDVQDAPQVKLVIDGRTMIPTSPEGRAYSRTFGAQAKLEVQDATGKWVTVPSTTAILPKPPEFDRPFVLDVSKIWISESRKVRFTYLYKTYIDSILLDTTADVPVTITELPLESADLQPHGFDLRSGIGEWYDYVYGSPFSPPRYMIPGYYTKFGSVTPLLTDVDDKFVIFGGGDEITLRFQPPASAADGTRAYVFLWNGYYKTLKEDIPHTVEPLPFAAMSNFPYAETESYPADADHQAYRDTWNTRYEGP